jgi:hypothetical protein
MHLGSMIPADDGQLTGSVRCLKSEGAVWTMSVVVLDVDPQDLLQAPSADEQQPVEALGADCADPSLREGVRVGCTGVSTTSASSDRNTSSKARQNLASRSRRTKRILRCPSTSSRLRACWATQAPAGLAVTPARWTRRVSSSIKNTTYRRRSQTVSTVEEVAGDDPGGLLSEERLPCRGHPSRGRIDPMTSKRCTDGGCRDSHAKPLEFALDALIAQRGFSLARWMISCWTSASSYGRPDARWG